MSSNSISIGGSLSSPVPPTPLPLPPTLPPTTEKAAESTSQSGFDATLKAAASVDQAVAAAQAGTPAQTIGVNNPAEVDGSRVYGWQFSVFMRVNGELGDWGKALQAQFYKTSKAVAETFLNQDGWSGDPVGMLLNGTQSAMHAGQNMTADYLGSIRQAADGGLESLANSFTSWPWSGVGSNSSTGSADPVPKSGALDLARLRVSTLGQSSATTPSRPLPHNRNGATLIMVSAASAATPSLELGSSNHTTQDAAFKFLEKFLDLVKGFISDLNSSQDTASTATSERSQKTLETHSSETIVISNPPVTSGTDSPDNENLAVSSNQSPVTVA